MVLVILAGDIETNLGPRFQSDISKKYYTGLDRIVKWDDCGRCFHALCSELWKSGLLSLESMLERGSVQTAKLTATYAVILLKWAQGSTVWLL